MMSATYRESSLLVEVECDIAHISLNLAERQRQSVVVLVFDGRIGRHLHMRLSGNLDDVGEQVAAL